MERPWQYPIFLIQHGGGYASIVNSEGEGHDSQALVIFSSEAGALQFIMTCGIIGVPRELGNDREFAWLLKSLQAPVHEVVFDPAAQVDESSENAYRIPVAELLDDFLAPDNSPWNYPVYVVAQEQGLLSIEGEDADGRPMAAIAMFASEEHIQSYLEAAGEQGTPCPLRNLEEARAFLIGLSKYAAAVAWNPTIADGQRSARHCFTIETLLEKYLVASDG